MRIQDIISVQCFLILGFLYFCVKASDNKFKKVVELDLPLKNVDIKTLTAQIEDEDENNNDVNNGDDYWRKKCQLPPKKGFCFSNLKRYYYDVDEERCKLFTYGGCFGNENNFNTKRECQKRCEHKNKKHNGDVYWSDNMIVKVIEFSLPSKKVVKILPAQFVENGQSKKYQSERPRFCYLPKDKGFCNAYIPSYYYNWKTKSCKKFISGGCGGNKNNFETLAECEDICKVEKNYKNE